jgi:NTP pyrophosphatase (non-canonical NTP hydrolase)
MENKEKLEALNENSSIKEVTKYVYDMINERGFQDETAEEVLLLLTEELGELAKAIRKSGKNIAVDVTDDRDADVAGEIADIFNYLLAMCRIKNIDFIEAFKNKERKNVNRIWKKSKDSN